jgi:hypothetical protein
MHGGVGAGRQHGVKDTEELACSRRDSGLDGFSLSRETARDGWPVDERYPPIGGWLKSGAMLARTGGGNRLSIPAKFEVGIRPRLSPSTTPEYQVKSKW